MEESTKKLWLTKVKKGIIAVVESPYAPNNHNCIWLKQDTMYVYGNRGWEELSSSGGDTPEPEPLDPKYVRTPIEFVNFESKSITMEGASHLCNFSNMISVQEEATEYQEGSKLTWTAPGDEDYIYQETPTLINGDSTGDDAEMFSSMQQLLSVAYPNNTIELVSMTDYRMSNICIIIAEVDGSRKTFIVEYFDEAPVEGQSYTVDPPAEPVIDETELLKVFPQSSYPITLVPRVLTKDEYEGHTYVRIGYYGKDFDYEVFGTLTAQPHGWYIPTIGNDRYSGVQAVNGWLENFLGMSGTYTDIVPKNQQYLKLEFGNNAYFADITKDPENLEKTLIFVIPTSNWNNAYEIEGTGLTEEQILMDYFALNDPSQINDYSIQISLYYESGMH